MRELEIKRALMEYLIRNVKTEVISAEFPFHFGRRRADLICMQQGMVLGYEIKSAFDRVDRLPAQLDSYRKIFDFVYVVCDKKHLPAIRSSISSSVGIYVCAEDGVRRVRKARQIKSFDALVTLDAMPMEVLRKEFKVSAKSKFELCKKIECLYGGASIKDLFRRYVISKFGARTVTFQSEISAVVTLDDVFSLGLPSDRLGA